MFKPSPIVQRALAVGCLIGFFQQSTGIDAVVYYTPLTFRSIGLDDRSVLLFTSLMGTSKLFFIFVAMALLDRVGRRPLLLVSSALMTLALCGLILSTLTQSAGVAIFLQCAYVGAFSIGWGPWFVGSCLWCVLELCIVLLSCWVMISEIFPLQIRSRGMAVATCVNRLTAGVVTLCFLSVSDLLTPAGSWSLFTVFSGLAFVFAYKYVPGLGLFAMRIICSLRVCVCLKRRNQEQDAGGDHQQFDARRGSSRGA